MSGRLAGAAMMALGVAVLVAGIAEVADSRNDSVQPAGSSTTTTMVAAGAAVASTTSSTATATATPAPSPTTTEASTTTTIAAETVDAFVADFARAVADGDVEFVFSRLHPAVIELYGDELCRAWTEREIMALGEYQLTGPVAGPEDVAVSADGATVEVSDLFVAPVRFAFQGESFDAQGQFAPVDGVIHWLGVCR
jgi:hypothetical protein